MTNLIETTQIKGSLFAALMMGTVIPTLAAADDVVLKSADGSINLSGELVEFTDQFYVLRTTLGDLRVSAERVRCEGDGCPALEEIDADIVLAGSDTLGQGLMPLLMQGYAAQIDAEATVTATANASEVTAAFVGDSGYGEDIGTYLLSSTGSNDAFIKLEDGSAQIGMSSRRITPDEARALKKSGSGNMISPSQEHIIAVDGLVMIVHPSNPLKSLTTDQVQKIYTGQITNWSEIGGPNLAVQPVSRGLGSATRQVFEERMLPDSVSGNMTIAGDNNEVAALVNAQTGAVGYVGFAFRRGAKAMPLVNECGITTAPDSFSAKTEEYALQRRMYLYNRADVSNPMLSGLLDFAKSSSADGVIRKAGFIDLGIELRAQDTASVRAVNLNAQNPNSYEGKFAKEMLEMMGDYARLSTTFRFRTGSLKLDERGKLDMERLATFVDAQPEGTKIMMVGFTDDVGAFDANLALSKERAEAVADQFTAKYPALAERISIEATGYGEVAPVACNVSDAGRAINRRVEIWLQTTPGLSG
ncbi:MAG: phosphate ABC transporter substrate-binding/OmpA family protein [Pseudomonadota bacterium]